MAIITDAVLGAGTTYANQGAPSLNLTYGGQMGHMPNFGRIGLDGKLQAEWISSQAYVQHDVIPIVLDYPRFLDFLPSSDKWIGYYKALMELHPISIEGLNATLTVELEEHAIGGSGEMMSEIVNVKRTPSALTFTYKELAGRAIQSYLESFIRYGYMNEYTKQVEVANFISSAAAMGNMYTANFTSGTMIFIEPDITQKVVNKAFLCTNILFEGSGDNLGKRNKTESRQMLDLSISAKCITMVGPQVNALATKLLNAMVAPNLVPGRDMIIPTDGVNSNLAAVDSGYDSVGQNLTNSGIFNSSTTI